MLLAIDTCGTMGGVALGNGEGGATLYRELPGKTFSEQLLATISALLEESGVSPGKLAGIAVVHGPGSFTGIRIGVSAAKGLAEAVEIPLVALSRLELLARQVQGRGAIAVLDAGRAEFYTGVYQATASGGLLCEAEALTTRAELTALAAKLPLPMLICEDRVGEGLSELAPVRVPAPTAVDALRLGMGRFLSGSFADVAGLDANYLRRSEIEMLERIAQHAALRAASAGGTSR